MDQITAALEGLQWGTVGEWVGGVGAVVAVLVALRIASRERTDRKAAEARTLKVEGDAALDRLWAQARSVAAWTTTRFGTPEDRESNGEIPLVVWKLTIVNGSSQPVFDIKVRHFAVEPHHHLQTEVHDLEALGPQDRDVTKPSKGHPYAGEIVMQFTDAAGIRWERHERGSLRPVEGDEIWPS